jgi:hypothetical protein
MNTYRIDVKQSNRTEAQLGKWCLPGRIWLRGFNEKGVKVLQEHIAFVDLRNKGPNSNFAECIEKAAKRMKELSTSN